MNYGTFGGKYLGCTYERPEPWGTPRPAYRRDTDAPRPPSRGACDTPDAVAAAAKRPEMRYSGMNMIGIATMHKSNAVPVFNNDDAVAVATMRRG
jgi:hypothetical protein